MQELIPDIDRWRAEGKQVAIATVIETWSSSPRPVGAKMAFTPQHDISGSVSAGCVEGAVIESGLELLRKGGQKILQFGVSDDTAWEVGLTCGGKIEVLVQPINWPFYDKVRQAILAAQAAVHLSVIQAPNSSLERQILILDHEAIDLTTFNTAQLDRNLILGETGDEIGCLLTRVALEALKSEQPRRRTIQAGPDLTLEVFADVMLPPPTLIIVGGVHIAIALVSFAKTLGYRVIVVDPRRPFASRERFPEADQLLHLWSDEALTQIGLTRSTAVVMLSHDPKLDDPALMVALPSPAFYVGALGSRRTQALRRQRLAEAGLTQEQIDRIHGPIGLDIHARTPAEIALSILAEIVQVRNQ